MLRSLRLRLLLALLAVVAVAVGTVALYGSSATSKEFQRYVSNESSRRAQAVAELLIYYRQTRSWRDVQPLLEQMAQISGDWIVLADEKGRIIADSQNFLADDPRLFRILNELEGQPIDLGLGQPAVEITSISKQRVFLYIVPQGQQESSEGVFLGAVNRQLLLAIFAAGLVGLLLTLLFSRSIVRPVEALTAAARKMGQGDLEQRVDISTQGEIGDLARAFNIMADGLARQEKLRRNMVSDVAHELRTPLSNLRGYLEALRDGVLTPTPPLIDSLYEETMILNHLVDDLQDLALIEAGQLQLMQEPTLVEEIVIRIVHQMEPFAAQKDLTIAVKLPPELPLVDVDCDRIGQVLRNMINNAISYSSPGGTITISARVRMAMVELSVEDEGVGIDPKHLPHIFDRFYRADRSRARATGGSGLGLAIARQIIEAHGGRVQIKSVPDRGTIVIFTMPVSDTQLADFDMSEG
ncbi:MAG TPA: HAMP domain-containing protein [Caldilineae bacterium]|nr:HAMP domain-containing protein [Caldilineae bacterium]